MSHSEHQRRPWVEIEDEKTIPIWPGALIVSEGGNVYRVIRVRPDDGRLYLASHGWGNTLDWYNPAGCYVDLRDPDTFRGAVARLALKLGAPEEAVMVGVQFNRDGGNTCTLWTLFAGGRPEWDAKDPRYWEGACFISSTTDPIEALAAWWASLAEGTP